MLTKTFRTGQPVPWRFKPGTVATITWIEVVGPPDVAEMAWYRAVRVDELPTSTSKLWGHKTEDAFWTQVDPLYCCAEGSYLSSFEPIAVHTLFVLPWQLDRVTLGTLKLDRQWQRSRQVDAGLSNLFLGGHVWVQSLLCPGRPIALLNVCSHQQQSVFLTQDLLMLQCSEPRARHAVDIEVAPG